jgi:hypothetical protein
MAEVRQLLSRFVILMLVRFPSHRVAHWLFWA